MSDPLTYRSSGVDIDAGNELVNRIKPIVKATYREGVLGGLGGFGGCFELPIHRYRQPVLVSSTDGVGTKLRLAIDNDHHHTVGIDLVAMCVNDLIVMGAEPLFFLDYFATAKLDVDVAQSVIAGIAKGCQEANVALIGGETAEMPGMYAQKDYDLAGFTVGIVEKEEVIDGKNICPGDLLIALKSSGPHSNGFSLIRKIIDTHQLALDQIVGDLPLSKALLAPTRIYVKSLLAIIGEKLLKGAAHITGGGFTENIPRVLPDNCAALIDVKSWQYPAVFQLLQEKAQLSHAEMRRTFNCGAGMILCVSKENAAKTLMLLIQHGEMPWVIGEVIERQGNAGVVYSDE